MATEDHLDKETSLSVELTETGVKAKAKSRTIAAIDRLAGSVFEGGSAWFEQRTSLARAKMEGERQLIEATAKYGVERLGYDKEFAKRAFENHFGKVARSQINKDEVVHEALEDLRREPPSETENGSGPTELDNQFMHRFEQFAEGASSEELRQRWGRVLAAEVRKPGTFSPKVLRATDELDFETARLFECLMQYRVKDALLKPIMPDLGFAEKLALVAAGLIVDPGLMGHINEFVEAQDNRGVKLWVYGFGGFAGGLEQSLALTYGTAAPIRESSGKPAVPVYVLTDVGQALSSIIATDENRALLSFAAALKSYLAPGDLRLFAAEGNGNWKLASDARLNV